MSSNDAIVVSGCDAAYLPMLQELWTSMVESGAFDRVDFGVLDLGLPDPGRRWLANRGIPFVRPPWPYPGIQGRAPEWFKAMACRPFLPDWFADWDFVLWMDADSWVQDASALDLFIEAAAMDGFAVVPSVDRAYMETSTWAPEWFRACLQLGYGPEVADRFRYHPIVAAGALCGATRAPQWELWQDYTRRALERQLFREAEQTALSLMVHEHNSAFQFLPSYCHWVCNMRAPAYDTESRMFVEPYPPHHPIGVMGLAADTKTETVAVATLDGRVLSRSLRFCSKDVP